jgi:hypothetical protein
MDTARGVKNVFNFAVSRDLTQIFVYSLGWLYEINKKHDLRPGKQPGQILDLEK